MTITKFEKTIIPQTLEGQEFAYEYEKSLTKQGAFIGRAEDTQSIIIKAQYHLTFTGEVKYEND